MEKFLVLFIFLNDELENRNQVSVIYKAYTTSRKKMPKLNLTRSKTQHFMLGQPAPLPSSQLPTRGDVINHVKWVMSSEGVGSRRPPDSVIFRNVASQVIKLWADEGIPTHDQYYVSKRIKVECYDALKKANKSSKGLRQAIAGGKSAYFPCFLILPNASAALGKFARAL